MIVRALRRGVGRDARADQGFTLVELLVAMVITTIALSIIGALLSAVVKTTADSNVTRSATGAAANAMNEITRVIRASAATATGTDASGNQTLPTPAVLTATPTALTVTSNIAGTAAAPAPVRVAFTVDAQGQLIETQTAAVLTNGLWAYGTTTTARTIASPLVTTGDALFVYKDSTGAVLTPGAAGLTSTQRGQVASITVTVTVDNPQLRTGSSPVVLTSQVGMPNLALTGGGS